MQTFKVPFLFETKPIRFKCNRISAHQKKNSWTNIYIAIEGKIKHVVECLNLNTKIHNFIRHLYLWNFKLKIVILDSTKKLIILSFRSFKMNFNVVLRSNRENQKKKFKSFHHFRMCKVKFFFLLHLCKMTSFYLHVFHLIKRIVQQSIAHTAKRLWKKATAQSAEDNGYWNSVRFEQ